MSTLQRDYLLTAHRERQEFGYMTNHTRARLEDIGMTAAQIEAALINMENTNG